VFSGPSAPGPSNCTVARRRGGTRALRSRVMSTQLSICFAPSARTVCAARAGRSSWDLRASSAPTALATVTTRIDGRMAARRRREVAARPSPAAAAPHHCSLFRTHQPGRRPDHPRHPRIIPLPPQLPLARWPHALPASADGAGRSGTGSWLVAHLLPRKATPTLFPPIKQTPFRRVTSRRSLRSTPPPTGHSG
jgi:hypothetical protein